jgi:hypothetical protein
MRLNVVVGLAEDGMNERDVVDVLPQVREHF